MSFRDQQKKGLVDQKNESIQTARHFNHTYDLSKSISGLRNSNSIKNITVENPDEEAEYVPKKKSIIANSRHFSANIPKLKDNHYEHKSKYIENQDKIIIEDNLEDTYLNKQDESDT